MAEKYQLNVNPSDRSKELIDRLITKFGDRHVEAKSRNQVVAACLELYLPLFAELLASKEDKLKSQYDQTLADLGRKKAGKT